MRKLKYHMVKMPAYSPTTPQNCNQEAELKAEPASQWKACQAPASRSFQGRHRKQLLLFLYEKHVKLGLKDKKWVFFPLVLGFRFSVCFLNLNAHEDSLLNLVLIS